MKRLIPLLCVLSALALIGCKKHADHEGHADEHGHTVKYTRVAGHSGHPENDRVDELAVAAYQQFLK